MTSKRAVLETLSHETLRDLVDAFELESNDRRVKISSDQHQSRTGVRARVRQGHQAHMNHFSEKVSFIWAVADLLRGDYKQSEYGRVILPFLVLRRLDRVLAPRERQCWPPPPSSRRTNPPEALRERMLIKASGETFNSYLLVVSASDLNCACAWIPCLWRGKRVSPGAGDDAGIRRLRLVGKARVAAGLSKRDADGPWLALFLAGEGA